MKTEKADMLDILKDVLHPLPENIQKSAQELHRHYTEMGMTYVTLDSNTIHFAYAYVNNYQREIFGMKIYQKRLWEFEISMKFGYCLVVRSNKTDKYKDVIAEFPLYLQEKIAQGYGCDRKLRNERCQKGCLGIRIPLDESLANMKQAIIIWLDNELPGSLRK